MEKLFLLDAFALIYRAYYALIRTPRITSTGFNTSAIFGFCNTLDEVLRKEEPSHIAVCFDPPGRTFRHDMYQEYKARREAQPEDITASIPVIKEIIEAYRIPIFEVGGYEADDVIGTLSRLATQEGFTTYMMTPDKDYGQLVTDRVLMYKPSLRGVDFELRGVKEVCDKYDIASPSQVIDLLALEGDSIDNIPGCPGVGPKTAARLIHDYSTVENLLDHADGIKGALGQKIRDNAEQIRFSKQLATIRTDVPLSVNFDALRREPVDVERLREIFTRLEFKTFLNRLKDAVQVNSMPRVAAVAEEPEQRSLFDFIQGGESVPGGAAAASSEQSPAGTPGADAPGSVPASGAVAAPEADYAEITTTEELSLLVETAVKAPAAGIALYAVGEEAMRAIFKAVAVATAPGRARLVTLPVRASERAEMMALLEPLFNAENTTLCSADIKRDMVLLRREKIELSAPYFDLTLAHYLLQPEMRHRLSDVALSVLGFHTWDYALGESARRKPFAALPPERELQALCEAADLALRLRQPLRDLLKANGQLGLLDDVELPVARVLADMEWTGVRVDTGELHRLSVELTARLREIEEEAYKLAGQKFNIGSPSQVGEILFGQMKLDPKAKRTKTGSYSTTEDILEKHRADHPVVDLILRGRALKKLLATYVNALPEMVNPHTGKLHTTFGQTVTATGRISSSNPNLQNIPVRSDDGRDIHRAFIADPGCLILSADYSQIELRLLANFSNDPELTEAFNSGLDIHRSTASKIYHVPYDEVTDNQRRAAKTANFGSVYGISAFGLSQRLGMPRKEAQQLIDGYFRTYPHIQQYIEKAIERARADGYVSTILDRKRYLPDINSRNNTVRGFAERNAVNAPLQGSAADIIKTAMVNIAREMRRLGLRSEMIMQVHDELIFNVVPAELPTLQELVTRLMAAAYDKGAVPLEVSSGTGTNWFDAH